MLKGSAYVLILAAIGLSLLAAAIGGDWERFPPAHYAPSVEPRRPGQEHLISSGVFAVGRLWLLSDSGELWALDQDAQEPVKIAAPGSVMGLCVQQGAPIIASQDSAASGWKLMRWNKSGWIEIVSEPTIGDGLVAITCEPDRLTLITSRRMIEFEGLTRHAVTLSNRIPSKLPAVVLTTPARLFVGLNVGEWGGGLQTIDRRTGEVRRLENRAASDPCGGPLNSDCDPVNGIAVSPWKPGCVLAAVGLVHATARGRLVEVCDADIETAYSEPCSGADSPNCSMPFFGLMAEDDRVLAVSPKGVVSLGRDGRAEHLPAPLFKWRGPFEVAFEPDYVLVKTSINQQRSLSGMTPLLIRR